MSSVARAGKPKAAGTKGQDGGKGGHRTSTSPMGPRAAAQHAPPGLQQHGLKLLNKDAESAKASRWRFVSAQDEMHQAGTRVRAVLRDGTEFEGKFFTGDTDSARVAIYVQTVLKRGDADQAQDIEEEVIVMLDDTSLVSFETLGPVKELRAGDGPGGSGAGGKFETDVDISHKRSLSAGRPGAERMLERVDDSWLLGAEAQENGGGKKTVTGALTGTAGGWDQFKANERFGVKADFNEELYTTPKPKMSAEREAEAARLAREIEGETAKNTHVAEERGQHIANDLDEEDRFSGVMRGTEQRNSGYRGDARGGKRGGGGGKAPSAYIPEPELAVRLLPSGRDGMYVPPARRQQQVMSPTEAASARADRDFESEPPQQQPVVLHPPAPTSPKRLDKAAPQPTPTIPATPSDHIDAPKATAAPPAATPVKAHTDEKANKSSEASTATTTPASSRSSTPSFRKSLNVHAKEFVPGGVKAVTAPTPPVMTPPQAPHHPPAHQPPPHHHQPPPQQTPPPQPQPPPQQQSPQQQQQQQPPHQPGGMPQPQMYPQQHRPPYYYPQQPGQFVAQYGMGPPRGQGGGYDSMPPPPGTVPVAAYMQQPQGRGPMGPGSPYPPGAIPMGQGPGIPGVYPQQYENPQMSGQMVMPPGQYLMPYGNVARGYGSPVPGQMMGRGQAGQFPRGPQGQQYMGPPQAGQPVRGHYGMEQGYMGPDGQPGPLDMGGYPDSPQHMGGPGTPGLMPKDNEALSPAHMPMPPPHGHSPHGPPQYGPQAYMSRDAARGRGQRTPKADRGGRGKMLSRGGRMGGMGRGHTGSPIPQGAGMPPHHVVSPQHGSMPSPMGPLPAPPLPAPPDMHPSALPPPQAPPLGDQA